MTTGVRLRTIIQGEFQVGDEPELVIATTVGSCVAACLYDPSRGVGGMNHFLLPDRAMGGKGHDDSCQRYGVHLMELLINALLAHGAARSRLQAKVFGGACITRGLTDTGPRNARFVQEFLQHEGISLVGGSLQGEQGRRVQFWPASGRARQMLCGLVEALPPPPSAGVGRRQGEVELF